MYLTFGFKVGEFCDVPRRESRFEHIACPEDRRHILLTHSFFVVYETHLRETRVDEIEKIEIGIIGFLVHENTISGNDIGFFRGGESYKKLGTVGFYDDFESIWKESGYFRMFDILLKGREFPENLRRFYKKYRFIVDIFYGLIGDIDIGNGIQTFYNNLRRRYPKIGRKEKYVTTGNDEKSSDEDKRKAKSILVLFQDIDNGIKIVESFFLSKKSEERSGSFVCFFCIKKIALLFFERCFFSEFSIFPVSNNPLYTIFQLSRSVHIAWRVH